MIDVTDQFKFNFSSPGGDANRWFNIGYAQILTSDRGTSPQLNMEIYLSNLIASATPSDYTIFLQFRPSTEAIFDSTNTYPLYYKAYYYYLSSNTDTMISKPRIYISQDVVGASTIYRFYLDLGIYIAENNIYSGSFATGQSYIKVNGRLGFNYTGSFYYTYNGGVYREITANRLLHSVQL
jgi:hypothetical protein